MVLLILLGAAGCSNSSFQSSKKTPVTGKATGAGEPPPGKKTDESDSTGGGTPQEQRQALVEKAFPKNVCDSDIPNQKVLILDLKSGWFAGDGGDFYKGVTNLPCGAKISIDYIHATKKVLEGNVFENGSAKSILTCESSGRQPVSFDGVGSKIDIRTDSLCKIQNISTYQQIWLLSGSPSDPDDVSLSSPFFLSFLESLKPWIRPSKGLFLGAGIGNTAHANAVAESVGGAAWTQLLAPGELGETGDLPNPAAFQRNAPKAPLVPAATLAKGTFLSSFGLFKDLTSVDDYVPGKVCRKGLGNFDPTNLSSFGPDTCYGDQIVSSKITPVVSDVCDQKVAGYSLDPALPKLYVDTNMARFYLPSNAIYLQKILGLLGQTK